MGDGLGDGRDPAIYDKEYLEIGNSVFMQYKKTETGWEELPQKNVDFGGGLERIAMVVQGKRDIYETDNFWPLIEKLQVPTNKNYADSEENRKAMRIVADHMRTATFLAMDGVLPSNKDQGYMLRRVLRRLVRAGRKLGLQENISTNLVSIVVDMFSWLYPQLIEMQENIVDIFSQEEEKFRRVLIKGSSEALKCLATFSGSEEDLALIAFDLYQSLGYPGEMFFEDVVDAFECCSNSNWP